MSVNHIEIRRVISGKYIILVNGILLNDKSYHTIDKAAKVAYKYCKGQQ